MTELAKQRTALVTGASGFIGRHLQHSLIENGYKVRALSRKASHLTYVHPSVEVIRGDICDRKAVAIAVNGASVIFHLASKLHIPDPVEAQRQEYWNVNVEGTRSLAESAREAGTERVVFFSSINVYGPNQTHDIFREDAPLNPDSWYAETKAVGEEILMGECPSVVLRLAAVYGPGLKGNYLRLLGALQKKRFLMLGKGLNRRTLVYVQDLCSAAVLAAGSAGAVGQIFNVTDGAIHTLRQIVDAMASAVGAPSPRLRLPVYPVRLLLGIAEFVARPLGLKSPVRMSTLDKFLEDMAVSGDKIKEKLGFCPIYDLERGWRETAVWYKSGLVDARR